MRYEGYIVNEARLKPRVTRTLFFITNIKQSLLVTFLLLICASPVILHIYIFTCCIPTLQRLKFIYSPSVKLLHLVPLLLC